MGRAKALAAAIGLLPSIRREVQMIPANEEEKAWRTDSRASNRRVCRDPVMERGFAVGSKDLATIVRNLAFLWPAQKAMNDNELIEKL